MRNQLFDEMFVSGGASSNTEDKEKNVVKKCLKKKLCMLIELNFFKKNYWGGVLEVFFLHIIQATNQI